MSKHILMIITSNDRMGDTGKPTGVWAEELAVPYYALVDAGHAVTLASPQGGAIPLDPSSVTGEASHDPAVVRMKGDAALQALLAVTRPVAGIEFSGFDAVFFPGGHGTMWDLPGNADVRRLVEAAHAQGKWISAVCHGVVGLVDARRADGESIVAGQRISAFTDAEEAAVGLSALMPFLLESRLRELGADFQPAGNWQAFAVRDGQFITGQNPQSSKQVVELLLGALAE
ncbi:MAG TPA: type 1 glutamine amidotransferase domain-containing protein [Chitinolyticbacter sp.]|nr:type 1 glutamine amidotransferase domain-containing protein [Chitinolyticbacter sp.]